MNTITLPGLIDIHVHLRTPGQEDKEDFESGTRAALAGGFTLVFDMPNNLKPITSNLNLEEKIQAAKGKIYADLGFYFGSLGDNLDEFERISGKVYGLKLYLNETTGNFLISKEKLNDIFIAWKNATGKPVLVHAEDDAVEAVINICRKTRQKVHFCHISLASDLDKIVMAKNEDLPVTCGVAPHHLFLTQEDTKKLGPYGKMKPYLKSYEDVKFLWENIGDIDAVESDHAPHTKSEKDSEGPPFGVPGLETTLPLLLTAAAEGKLTIEDIKRLCYEGPRKILGIERDTGTVEVDTGTQYEIKNENLFTKCGWSPFAGRKVYGRVKKVALAGKTIFENGKFAEPPKGEVI